MTRLLALAAALLVAATTAWAQERPPMQESPFLADRVAAGTLPPVEDRVPLVPAIRDLKASGRAFGVPGGRLRTMVTRARDVRLMVTWGYARLVGYGADYTLEPDILQAVEIEGGRRFTLRLRPGHRWSDGHPFTAEDFRYYWEDVANNPELSPSGPPAFLMVGGEYPKVTFPDAQTVVYEWRVPNPRFLPTLAQARPPFIYRPAHHLKRFHAAYAEADTLAAMVEADRARNWAQLHNQQDEMYDFDLPDLPTLQPWVNLSERNNQRYNLARNPFFHRVDAQGVQLPYIDEVEVTVVAGGLITARLAQGNADLQVRGIGFSDIAVLKASEDSGGYTTHLWTSGVGSEIALYPNLNFEEPQMRALLRDRRFRRALSLGIDRRAISESLYFGLAKPRRVAPLEQSPFFDPARAEAPFDPAEANRLLDALGLTARASDGTRLLPGGQRLDIVAESAGERQEESDALELVAEMWRGIGINLIHRPLDRDILRNLAYRGAAMMPVWSAWNNGIPTADYPPEEQTPVRQDTFTWPKWGQHFQTKGQAGEPPDTAEGARLMELYHDWLDATDAAGRATAWTEILDIHAEQEFVIGLVSGVPQPVVASNRLRNVPSEGLYAWDPGAHLGVHRMDEFFFAP
jgi:peptide/nickel transport system substrate-binding protein